MLTLWPRLTHPDSAYHFFDFKPGVECNIDPSKPLYFHTLGPNRVLTCHTPLHTDDLKNALSATIWRTELNPDHGQLELASCIDGLGAYVPAHELNPPYNASYIELADGSFHFIFPCCSFSTNINPFGA